jgi:hypothetical protein
MQIALTLIVFVLLPTSAIAETSPLLRDLIETGGFSKSDIQRMSDEPLVRELDVKDSSRRAAFAGIVRIEGDGSNLARVLQSVDFASVDEATHASGRFADPPTAADVTGIRFQDDDLEVLSDCEVRDCKFKLTREGIESLASIDWSSPDAGDVFAARFQQEVLAYVQRYQAEGSSALVLYEDKSAPVSLATTVDALMKEFPEFERHAASTARHLVDYPKGTSPEISDTILWSIKDFGYRPTIAVEHLIVNTDPQLKGATSLVATKTIYANHYLAGRIQVGATLNGEASLGIPGHFIVLVDQIQFDEALNGFKRGLLGRGLKTDVENRMKLLRALADGAR